MGSDFDPEVNQPDDDEQQFYRTGLPSMAARFAGKTATLGSGPSPTGILPPTDSAPAAPPALKVDSSALPPGIVRSQLRPEEIPSPAASSPATTTLPGLMQRRLEMAKPIDPNTVDASGKKIYRMPMWQRIVGGIGDFASGFAGNRTPPTYIGPGATNQRYSHDVGMQQEGLSALDTDIGNQEKLAESQRKLYDSAIKQAYEGQLGEARIGMSEAAQGRADAAQQLADVKGQLVTTQNELNRAKAAQASAGANQKDATRPTKVMGNRTYEKQDDGSWKDIGAAPVKGTGGKGGGSKNAALFDRIEKDKDKALQDGEKRYSDTLKLLRPSDAVGRQRALDQLNNAKAQAQANYEARIKQAGGSIASPPGQQTVRMPPPNKVVPTGGASKQQGEYSVGQTVMVGDKPYRVIGINPKTNKPRVVPQ